MSEAERIACHECDLLMTIAPLAEGQTAECPRCGHFLTVARSDRATRALAFAAAGLVLLPLANIYPFLFIKASGLENSFKLPESTEILFAHHGQVLGLLIMGFIVVLPGVMLLLVLAVVVPVVRGRDAPWLAFAGRVLFGVNPWSMVEVFLIGVIVALVKVANLATVVLGVSFWAYIAFALCFIAAMSQMDRLAVWDAIERVARR